MMVWSTYGGVTFGLTFLIGGIFSWSIYYSLEYVCTSKCRDSGKPFGRLLGQTCSCYCPIMNPSVDNDPCEDSEGPSCQLFCQIQGYSGGDCVVGGICWCFCRVKDPYLLQPTTTTTEAAVTNATTTEASNATTTEATATTVVVPGGGGGIAALAPDVGVNDPIADGSATAPGAGGLGGVTGADTGDVGALDPAAQAQGVGAETDTATTAPSSVNASDNETETSSVSNDTPGNVTLSTPDIGSEETNSTESSETLLPMAFLLQNESSNCTTLIESERIEDHSIRPCAVSSTAEKLPRPISTSTPITSPGLTWSLSSSTFRPGTLSQTLTWSWTPTTMLTFLRNSLRRTLLLN